MRIEMRQTPAPCRFINPELLFFAVSLLILILAYFPSFAPFGIHNDYSFLEITDRDWWLKYDESWWLYRIGRPIGSVLMSVQMLLMNDVMSFAFWRIFAVVLGWILALLLAMLLASRAGFSRRQSVLMGTGVLLLPAAQVSVLWLTMIGLGLIAPIVGLLAYRVLPPLSAPMSVQAFFSSVTQHSLRYLGAVLLLISAMLIYPANAILGLAVTAAIVLGRGDLQSKQFQVLRDVAVVGAAMLLYYIIVRTELLPLASGGVNLPEYQLKVSFSFPDQLRNFVNILGISFSSPWNVLVGIPAGITINSVLFFLLGCMAYRAAKPRGREIAVLSSLVIIILIVANLPVLLAPKGYYDAFRTSFTTQAIVLIVFGVVVRIAAEKSPTLTRNAACFCLVASVLFAMLNCMLVRSNNVRELAYISDALSRAVAEKRDIVYHLNKRGSSYSDWPARFEFALSVTHYPHLNGIISGREKDIAAAGIAVAAVDEDDLFWVLSGGEPRPDAMICDLKTLNRVAAR